MLNTAKFAGRAAVSPFSAANQGISKYFDLISGNVGFGRRGKASSSGKSGNGKAGKVAAAAGSGAAAAGAAVQRYRERGLQRTDGAGNPDKTPPTGDLTRHPGDGFPESLFLIMSP